MLAAVGVLAANSGGSPLASFVPLLLIVLVGYFLLVRPARARQREMATIRSRVEPGVEVQTTAGMLATVVSVEDDGVVVLEVAPGVHSRYLAAAIARVITPEPMPETIDEPDADDAGGDGSDGSDASR
jgi:preprotein translocase subunit YajC